MLILHISQFLTQNKNRWSLLKLRPYLCNINKCNTQSHKLCPARLPTFVLVCLWLDAEDGDDGDDDDDGGGGESDHEPRLAVERLLLEGPVLKVLLARGSHLKKYTKLYKYTLFFKVYKNCFCCSHVRLKKRFLQKLFRGSQ